MYHFHNHFRLRQRLVAAVLTIAMLTASFIYPSFANNEKTMIDAWVFETKDNSIYWSDFNNRWEIKLTTDQLSLSAEELCKQLALPEYICVSEYTIATASDAVTASEATGLEKWTAASGSNAERIEEKATSSEAADDEEEEEFPDYDILADQNLENSTNVNKIKKQVSHDAKMKATVSNAVSNDTIKVPITWDWTPLYDYIAENSDKTDSAEETSIQQTTEITIKASLESDMYELSPTANPVEIAIILAPDNPFDEAMLEANRIETESPEGLTLNLFDYWNTTKTAADHFGWGAYNNKKEWETEFWKKNIGANHVLQFLGAESNEKFGDWNSWIGSAKSAYQGLVQRKLVNGYPALNIADSKLSATTELSGRNGKESLSYLFDPEEEHDGKESFANVKGLLSKNGAGYTYSCAKNFAEFMSTPNDEDSAGYYRVYNTWGIRTNSGQNGQYFPFASMGKAFSDKDGVLTPNNIDGRQFTHFFGLSGSMEFSKPKDGIVRFNASKANLHFNISGTDDIWVYVDDILVGDGGGNSDEKVINIDFATGDVVVKRAANNTEATTYATTLKECFALAGENTDHFVGNTFADNTTHTLKFFQLERGSNASFLGLDFNTLNLNDLNEAALAKNRIQTVTPENIRIDLHDYWNTGKYDKDYYVSWQSDTEYATEF